MLFSKVKDIKLRNKFLKTEFKIKVNKYIFINLLTKFKSLKKKKRVLLFKSLYLSDFKRHFSTSKVKLIKRCIIQNRSRNVSRSHRMSRLIFRDLISFGLIPGYKKAVW